MEGRIALGSLVRRFPDLRLEVDPSALRWRPGMNLRGLTSLPVRL
jgi:cytochrome P450